ncbi:MAG: hypothetical protein JO020_03630 [Chloroflexi bacterium]|nr:hypothetical protein [Chloroflexota bacterium]MBV9135201.1 hypothetical protein [Chloroflexota bacterium]MBV9893241.1 hypothetical protein [Chloroflexota bacterium]
MRVAGVEPNPLRRVFPLIVVLILLGAVVAVAVWARQQDAARRLAEDRADIAETQLVAAEASLTAIARVAAAATATATAGNNEPELALRRSLDLVFEAYKDPSEGKLKALTDAFSADALSFERTEAEHLISGGLHLEGGTPYELTVVSSSVGPTGDTTINTHEVWTYDEVDSQERHVRCVREDSDQAYTLRRIAAGWRVEDITLSGTPHRTDC